MHDSNIISINVYTNDNKIIDLCCIYNSLNTLDSCLLLIEVSKKLIFTDINENDNIQEHQAKRSGMNKLHNLYT